ncbi:hypothetical protein RyT2_30020 [Pseudolactococcus yaeyamensis]
MGKLIEKILKGNQSPKVVFERNIGSSFCVIVAEKGKLIGVSEMPLELYAPLTMMLEWHNDIYYKDDIFILITERQGYLPYEFEHYAKEKEYKDIISSIMKEDYNEKAFFIGIKGKFEVLDLAEQATP